MTAAIPALANWSSRINVIVQMADDLAHGHFGRLRQDSRFNLIYLSGTFEEILAKCLHSAPCILVASLGWLQQVDAAQKAELLRHDASVRVIACLENGVMPGVEAFAVTGCWALVPAETGTQELAQICEMVAKGGMWASPEVLSRVIRHLLSWGSANKLSRRERQIMELMADGKTNKNIAEELFLSEETIRWHLRNMYSKTGIVGREGMIRYARENAASA